MRHSFIQLLISSLFLVFFDATLLAQQIKAGDVAPDAKFLDMDMMSNFNDGAAIILKGNATALIDSKGNIVVPFNKYILGLMSAHSNISVSDLTWHNISFYNGMLIAHNIVTKKLELLNSKGKVLIPIPNNAIYLMKPRDRWKDNDAFYKFDDDGFFSFKAYPSQVSINSKGEKYIYNSQGDLLWQDGLSPQYGKTTTGNFKKGYINITGQFVIPAIYDEAYPFSEGLALIGKRDDFGVMKWGFIDRKGITIIPLQFSNRPSSFLFGMAIVTPKDNSEFEFAGIDKTGNIAVKITQEFKKKYGIYNELLAGYFHSSDYLIDKNLSVITKSDFFKSFGIQDGRLFFGRYNQFDSCLYFTRNDKVGMINLATRNVINPVFEEISLFDSVSNLARAKMFLRRDEVTKKDIFREGFINRGGVFVLLKSEPSKW